MERHKMRPFRVLVCLLFFIVASCTQDAGRYRAFPETVTVFTRQYDFDSVHLRYPYRIRVFDTSLYIMDLHPDQYYCHLFSYPSLQFRKSFAKRGRAPNEMTSIGNIAVNSEGVVYILNDFGRKIFTLNAGDEQIGVFAELSEELVYYADFVLYNDTTFIIPDYYGRCRFFFVDSHGDIIRHVGTIPQHERRGDVPESILGQAWRPFIGYNPRNGILALVTQFGEVIEIYDLVNDKVTVRVGKEGEPKYRVKGNEVLFPDGINAYSDVQVGDNYIYALFWGHEFKKILRREITVQGGRYIHVFDFEGNPVRKYELDRYITGLSVDEEKGAALGTDINEGQLVVFDL